MGEEGATIALNLSLFLYCGLSYTGGSSATADPPKDAVRRSEHPVRRHDGAPAEGDVVHEEGDLPGALVGLRLLPSHDEGRRVPCVEGGWW